MSITFKYIQNGDVEAIFAPKSGIITRIAKERGIPVTDIKLTQNHLYGEKK